MRRDAHETETQSIGTVFGHQVERIGGIAQTLRHFAALEVANDAGEKDVLERHLTGELQAGHDHARHPKKDDIRPRHQIVGRIKFLPRRLVHRGERPEPRTEPGIEHVVVLPPVVRIGRGIDPDVHDRRIIFPIPDRNTVPPPQLAADAPILDVRHPVLVNFRPAPGHKPDPARDHRIQGGRHLRIPQKPLLAQPRLDRHVSPLAKADIVVVIFHPHQQPHLLELLHRQVTRGKAFHPGELRTGQLVQRAIRVHHVDDRQMVTQPDLKIRPVVRRSDFQHTGAEGHVNVRVGHDGDLGPRERTHRMLADQARVARIVRVDRHRRVPHQSLRTRRGDFEKRPGFFRHFVAHHVELALGGLHDDFLVAQRRLRSRAPVDHPLAAVDEPPGMQLDENFLHLAGIVAVHGEALARPIARATEALQLLDDDPPVLLFPRPHPFEKRLAAEITPRLALFFAQLAFNHRLRGDPRVVRPRQPQDLVACLARPTRQNVLQSIVQDMPEGEHAGHVRRGNDNGKTRLGRGGIGREATLLDPLPIPTLLHGGGFVSFGNLGHRTKHHSGFPPGLQTLKSPAKTWRQKRAKPPPRPPTRPSRFLPA